MAAKNLDQLCDKMAKKYPSLRESQSSGELEREIRVAAFQSYYEIEQSIAGKELPHYYFVDRAHDHCVEMENGKLSEAVGKKANEQSQPRKQMVETMMMRSSLADKVCQNLDEQHKAARDPETGKMRGHSSVSGARQPSDIYFVHRNLPRSVSDELDKKFRNEIAEMMRGEQNQYLETMLSDFPDEYEEQKASYRERIYERYNERGKPVPPALQKMPEADLMTRHSNSLPTKKQAGTKQNKATLCGAKTTQGAACRQPVSQGGSCPHHR